MACVPGEILKPRKSSSGQHTPELALQDEFTRDVEGAVKASNGGMEFHTSMDILRGIFDGETDRFIAELEKQYAKNPNVTIEDVILSDAKFTAKFIRPEVGTWRMYFDMVVASNYGAQTIEDHAEGKARPSRSVAGVLLDALHYIQNPEEAKLSDGSIHGHGTKTTVSFESWRGLSEQGNHKKLAVFSDPVSGKPRIAASPGKPSTVKTKSNKDVIKEKGSIPNVETMTEQSLKEKRARIVRDLHTSTKTVFGKIMGYVGSENWSKKPLDSTRKEIAKANAVINPETGLRAVIDLPVFDTDGDKVSVLVDRPFPADDAKAWKMMDAMLGEKLPLAGADAEMNKILRQELFDSLRKKGVIPVEVPLQVGGEKPADDRTAYFDLSQPFDIEGKSWQSMIELPASLQNSGARIITSHADPSSILSNLGIDPNTTAELNQLGGDIEHGTEARKPSLEFSDLDEFERSTRDYSRQLTAREKQISEMNDADKKEIRKTQGDFIAKKLLDALKGSDNISSQISRLFNFTRIRADADPLAADYSSRALKDSTSLRNVDYEVAVKLSVSPLDYMRFLAFEKVANDRGAPTRMLHGPDGNNFYAPADLAADLPATFSTSYGGGGVIVAKTNTEHGNPFKHFAEVYKILDKHGSAPNSTLRFSMSMRPSFIHIMLNKNLRRSILDIADTKTYLHYVSELKEFLDNWNKTNRDLSKYGVTAGNRKLMREVIDTTIRDLWKNLKEKKKTLTKLDTPDAAELSKLIDEIQPRIRAHDKFSKIRRGFKAFKGMGFGSGSSLSGSSSSSLSDMSLQSDGIKSDGIRPPSSTSIESGLSTSPDSMRSSSSSSGFSSEPPSKFNADVNPDVKRPAKPVPVVPRK